MEKTRIFRVYNHNKLMTYKVATTTRSDDEILDIIRSMYEGTKVIYRIYKNDELILSLNTKKREYVYKRILEVNTGTIFENLKDMMDVLMLRRGDALKLVKTSFNYKYVD